jgi:endonuclease G, mitochondrial
MKIVFFSLACLFILMSCIIYPTSNIVHFKNQSTENGDSLAIRMLYYKYMTIRFSEQYKQPLWVAYPLCDTMLVKNVKRLSGFKADAAVKKYSATDADYKGSGYDKGHLKPAANCTFDSLAMLESFYYTNVSPQAPSFNRGVWSRLEDMERQLANKYGCIEVVNLPIFDSIIGYIGIGKIPVPYSFGKAFLVQDNGGVYKSIAFLLTNEGKPTGYEILDSAAVTVDSLEKRTGIDLFFYLSDTTQTRVESIISRDLFE